MHIRNTLDEALRGVTNSINVTADYGAHLKVREDYWRFQWQKESDPEPAKKQWKSEMQADMDRTYQSELVTRANQVRLEIRLGTNHSIVVSHAAVMNALIEVEKRVGDALHARLLEDPSEAAALTSHEEVGKSFTAFRNACLAWFHS